MKYRMLVFVSLALPCDAGVVTVLADRDQTLHESASGCCSNGSGTYFFAGDRSGGEINRGLLHFDVAAAVPAGSTILGVRLDLNLSRSRSDTESMTLHRVQQDWGEGTSATGAPAPGASIGAGAPAASGDATWLHTFAPGSLWTHPGGDYDAVPSATSLMGGAAGVGLQSFGSATMAADVQAWLDDDATNFGWLLRAEDEAGLRSARRFDTRESGNAAITPRIEVVFSESLGSNYCVAAANSAGPGAVISASGCLIAAQQAFTLQTTDLPSRAPGLFIFSSTRVQSPMGDGFLCVGGNRIGIYPPAFADSTGVARRDLNFATPAAATVIGGADLNFQFWYRDRAAAGSGHNLSDGLNVIFQ